MSVVLELFPSPHCKNKSTLNTDTEVQRTSEANEQLNNTNAESPNLAQHANSSS